MDILIDVIGQKLKLQTNQKRYIEGSQKFVRFVFTLNEDWDGLTTFAQFKQNGQSYNSTLDEENSVYLPVEIEEGTCTVTLYGTDGTIIATTDYIELTIDKNIVSHNSQSTQFTTSIYLQIVQKIDLKADKKDLEALQSRVSINENDIQAIRNQKLSIAQGTENAGKIFAVNTSGNLEAITLGEGLEIINGVLSITR